MIYGLTTILTIALIGCAKNKEVIIEELGVQPKSASSAAKEFNMRYDIATELYQTQRYAPAKGKVITLGVDNFLHWGKDGRYIEVMTKRGIEGLPC